MALDWWPAQSACCWDSVSENIVPRSRTANSISSRPRHSRYPLVSRQCRYCPSDAIRDSQSRPAAGCSTPPGVPLTPPSRASVAAERNAPPTPNQLKSGRPDVQVGSQLVESLDSRVSEWDTRRMRGAYRRASRPIDALAGRHGNCLQVLASWITGRQSSVTTSLVMLWRRIIYLCLLATRLRMWFIQFIQWT